MEDKGRWPKDEALKRVRVARPYYACRGIRGSYRGDSLGDTRNSPEWCNEEHERIRPRRRLLDYESGELLLPSIRGRGTQGDTVSRTSQALHARRCPRTLSVPVSLLPGGPVGIGRRSRAPDRSTEVRPWRRQAGLQGCVP